MTGEAPLFRADLHCHTTCSDGSYSPEEIVRLALNMGLKGLSITDHDSIEAYETAYPLAIKLGLRMVSGVEFSAVERESNVHILAYSFPLNCPLIREFCQKHQTRRLNRNLAILNLLKERKMFISEEEMIEASLGTKKSIGRPHIALAMVKKGFVGSIEEAFKKYLNEGGSCYVRGESFTVQETLDIIHASGGIAVIAHPHLIERTSTIKNLMQLNFDGLEGYYAKFPPKQELRWLKLAQNKKWLITGGSDFHGTFKPYIPLGCSWVNEETFQVLESIFINHRKI